MFVSHMYVCLCVCTCMCVCVIQFQVYIKSGIVDKGKLSHFIGWVTLSDYWRSELISMFARPFLHFHAGGVCKDGLAS